MATEGKSMKLIKQPKKPVSPWILKGDVTLRFVVPLATVTKQYSIAYISAFFGREMIEVEPVGTDFIDRFAVYNAKARYEEKAIMQAVKEIFGDGASAIDIAERIEDIYNAIVKIMRFVNGEEPMVDYLCGALLKDRVHFGKCKLQVGIDHGAIRVMVRPLASITFMPYIYFMPIIELLKFYATMYEQIGRPFVRKGTPELVAKLKKYGGTEIDPAIDLAVYKISNQRTIAFKTLVLFASGDGHIALADAKRLIHAPKLSNLRSVILVQSGESALVIFRLDDSISDILNNIKLITPTMLDTYLSGRTVGEVALIGDKVSVTYYGKYVASDEEETKGLIEDLVHELEGGASGGEVEEAVESAVEESPPAPSPKTVDRTLDELEEKASTSQAQSVKKQRRLDAVGGEEI